MSNLEDLLRQSIVNNYTRNNISAAAGTIASAQGLTNSVLGQGTYRRSIIDPNEHPAYQPSLRTLLDLWAARFGDKWVETGEVHADNFWGTASTRLQRAGALEQHEVWLRPKEL